MSFAEVNGIKLYYEVHGKGHPLVLVNGFTNNRFIWQFLLPFLTPHYQVIIFDNRGSGQSENTTPPYTIDLLAEDTIGLLRHLSLSNVFILGHSMGGAIVQQVCLSAPALVKRAVICSSFAKVPFLALFQIDTVRALFQSAIDPKLILSNVLPWLYSTEFLQSEQKRTEILDFMVKNPYPQSPIGYVGQGEALKQCDLTEKLSHIQIPCHVLVGNEDLFTPLNCSELLVKRIPKASLSILEGQGHMTIVERPKEIAAIVQEFCK